MNPTFTQHTAPLARLLPIAKGELAWHDWQRNLKVRKTANISPVYGCLAFERSLDAWHSDAFMQLDLRHLIDKSEQPRQVVFSAIDWCGNVIGQHADCEYGPTGRIYEVQDLGLSAAFYELQRYGLEMMPDGSWVWWLEFDYTDKCKHLARIWHQSERDSYLPSA